MCTILDCSTVELQPLLQVSYAICDMKNIITPGYGIWGGAADRLVPQVSSWVSITMEIWQLEADWTTQQHYP